MFVVAMNDESALVPKGEDCIVTGVGAINVIKSLQHVDRKTPIHNIGYAGSNSLPIGRRVSIGKVSLYHPNVEYDEQFFLLNGDVPCYTSCDFVTETDITEPCVFDMELAFILAMGFENVTAEKIISDNLSTEEFEECLRK